MPLVLHILNIFLHGWCNKAASCTGWLIVANLQESEPSLRCTLWDLYWSALPRSPYDEHDKMSPSLPMSPLSLEMFTARRASCFRCSYTALAAAAAIPPLLQADFLFIIESWAARLPIPSLILHDKSRQAASSSFFPATAIIQMKKCPSALTDGCSALLYCVCLLASAFSLSLRQRKIVCCTPV